MSETEQQTAQDVWGVIERSGDRGTVSFERRLATDPADLWQAMTSPDRLARWFCAVTGDLTLGGRYQADMGSDGMVAGRVLACEPPRTFRVSWDEGRDQESVIDVEVAAHEDGSVLRLSHSALPANTLVDYGAGWQGYLEVLESADPGQAEWSTERYRVLVPLYQQRFPDAG